MRLKNELNLAVDKKRNITIRTLAQQTTSSCGLTEFTLQLLSTDEIFQIKNACCAKVCWRWRHSSSSCERRKLEHFQGVTIPIIAQRKSIDILIGQTDKSLLTVLEEWESKHPDPPIMS